MASKVMLDEKQPVKILSAGFRMVVERVVAKFVNTSSETLEFPATLSKEQRDFINNYVFKSHGLKSKSAGKGPNLHIVVFKENENLLNTSNSLISLSSQSMKVLDKILELTNDSPPIDTINSSPESVPKDKKLSINLVSIGSVTRNRNSIISVPPKSWNPMCVKARETLPIFKHRREILNMFNSSQVMIIESTTGSGKSTQIPQYILEQASESESPCRIIVAEPKRICAVTLADRVSFERGEAIGSTVGYQIRLESKVAPTSNLIYVTNGVILRMLMSGRPEEFFQSITTLIVDEVHERDKFSDFLLLCIREYLPLNKKLKVVIMSATVESDAFSKYFGGCPVFKLEGRSHPVREYFLEDVLTLVNFSNPQVVELYKSCGDNPELLKPPVRCSRSVKNLDDDTKDCVNDFLDKMARSAECDMEFSQFLYMVQADGVPVDFVHVKTNRTALTFAVEYGLEVEVKQLLRMKADPTLMFEIDGQEMTALKMAIIKKHTSIATIIENHLLLMNASTPDNVIETSYFNQQLLDIYYDTLVMPGINRGVFLEDVVDLNLIVHLVRHIHFTTHTCNGILVFLPGHDEIVQLANLVCNALDTNYNIFILHSQMHTSDQTSVFDQMPPGIRKIIIATNIAESSITVNEVVYVIDSGKEKQKTFNAVTHVSSLRAQWISKASAKQRMGRAGRLCRGIVFRMYSRDRFNYLVETSIPEFLRCDMTDICLQAKMIAKSNESIACFLKKAITPPSDVTVKNSIKILQQLGALTLDESLTQLGLYIADIPLNAKYGKMLIYGIMFKCIDPVLTIVSLLSINEPFTLPSKVEERQMCHALKMKLEDGSYSDHFVMLKIFQKWNEYKTSNEFDGGFCEDNFVNSGTMDRIASTRVKIVGYLRSVRLIQSVGNISVLNENSHNWSIVKACISAGSYPDIARALKKRGEIVTAYDQKLLINPGSVLRPSYNTTVSKEHLSHLPAEWIIFEEKNLAGNLAMAKMCSVVSNATVALTAGLGLCVNDERWSDDGACGGDSTVELEVDQFIKFSADTTIAYALQRIRDKFSCLMNRFLMNVDKFKHTDSDDILIAGIVKLIELEDEQAGFKIKHEGIGSRPRIVTRDYNAPRERRSLDASVAVTNTHKQSFPKLPSATQQQNKNEVYGGGNKTNKPTIGSMRYFTIEMKPEELVNELKAKVLVLMDSDAHISGDFIDALIEMEINDRVSKKTVIFCSDTQIVGVGMLMNPGAKKIKRENMKMFFQSKQKLDLSMLK